MSSDLWKWTDPDGHERTASLDELRAGLASGSVSPNARVWRSGFGTWVPASEVAELRPDLSSPPGGFGSKIPPPPLAVVAVQQAFESKASESFAPPPLPNMPTTLGVAVPEAVTALAPRGPSARPSPPRNAPQVVTLPTAVGMPPPPELAALATTHEAAPLAPSAPPAPPPAVPADDFALPVAEPLWAPLVARLHGVASAIRALDDKRRRLAVGGAAALGVLVVSGLLVWACTGSSDSDKSAASAKSEARGEGASKASPDAALPDGAEPKADAPQPKALAAAAAPSEKHDALSACAAGGEARFVASNVRVASGIEITSAQAVLAFGFASSASEGLAVTVDPATLTPTATARARASQGDVRRVVPFLAGDGVVPVMDVDRKADRVSMRRVVRTNPPIDVGIAAGALVAVPHGQSRATTVFRLDGSGPVEPAVATPLADGAGIAVALRRGGAIYVGVAKEADGALRAVGPLARIEGLGQVGLPTVAAANDAVLVAWSDRADARDAWQIRWTTMDVATGTLAATVPARLALPTGGPGAQAMSPSVARLGGERFVIAWTEGPVANHQVRASVMTTREGLVGAPIAISALGENAGQPRIFVDNGGRGVVAFLAATDQDKAFDLYATPLACTAGR